MENRTKQQLGELATRPLSPLRFYALVLVSISCIELAIMFILDTHFPEFHGWQENMLDALMLPTLSAPLLWWLVVRPLRNLSLEEALRARTIIATSQDAIITLDASYTIRSINPAAQSLFGYGEEEIVGQPFTEIVPNSYCAGLHAHLTDYLAGIECGKAGGAQTEVTARRKDGETFPAELTLGEMGSRKKCLFVVTLRDITERKKSEENIRFLAHYDPLTRLPNRAMLQDRLDLALVNAKRNHRQVALLFLDLDRFKAINDTLGHAIGDLLLQTVAERLKGCVREGDTVARLGGDEFIVVLPDVAESGSAAHVAEKILEAVSRPYSLGGHEVGTTPSIGISVYPDDGQDIEILLKHADAAMYHAKKSGRNNYQFFTREMNVRALQRMTLGNSLKRALEREEFLLFYQPQVSLETGRITGMEALIRWEHPEIGLMLPESFIPVAEETGIINDIGEWVLFHACAQSVAWQEMGLPAIPVATNISAVQIRHPKFRESVQRILRQTGMEARQLELEITEGVLMQSPERVISLLRMLKEDGLRIAVDDFGAGYSSLSHLKRFPIDKLKIDASFIADLLKDADAAAITRAIIGLGRSLGLKVLAEGVESQDQYNFLQRHQCDEMQGYFFSRPLPASEAAHLLRKASRETSAA